jgi:hypothetical protein
MQLVFHFVKWCGGRKQSTNFQPPLIPVATNKLMAAEEIGEALLTAVPHRNTAARFPAFQLHT